MTQLLLTLSDMLFSDVPTLWQSSALLVMGVTVFTIKVINTDNEVFVSCYCFCSFRMTIFSDYKIVVRDIRIVDG